MANLFNWEGSMVTFSDLSVPLKIGVVGGFVYLTAMSLIGILYILPKLL